MIVHVDKLPLYFLCFFVDIFTRSFDDLISMKFLIAVFLLASPFINFGDFCQPPCLLLPPRLLFWPKFASLPVYSALPLLFETGEYFTKPVLFQCRVAEGSLRYLNSFTDSFDMLMRS